MCAVLLLVLLKFGDVADVVAFGLVWFGLFGLVWFLFVSFRFVSFRFVLFCFVLFRFVFVLHTCHEQHNVQPRHVTVTLHTDGAVELHVCKAFQCFLLHASVT